MKLAKTRTGNVVHRDDCRHALRAGPMPWADRLDDHAVYIGLLSYPTYRLCRSCFDGTVQQLAAKALQERKPPS